MSAANRGAEHASTPTFAWYHAWFSTFGTWLRGDLRGFRDHDHRIHSSGDYHHLPDPREHAPLRRWAIENMHKPPVRLTGPQRATAGRIIRAALERRGCRVLIVAVACDHTHLILRCPEGRARVLVGHAKRASSHALREQLPGSVWGRRCALRHITTRAQQSQTFAYIQHHAHRGAWVWTFRDPAEWRAGDASLSATIRCAHRGRVQRGATDPAAKTL